MRLIKQNSNPFHFLALFVLISAIIASCGSPDPKNIGFYYWKSEFKIRSTEKETFEKIKANKLYVRIFDVDKDGKYINPKGIINSFDPKALDTEYIPVVFITNRVFLNISEIENKKLAEDVFSLIEEILSKKKQVDFKEIQIDCDWTLSTKNEFFNFLEQLKIASNIRITSTLRLHQVKDKEIMGIPPVDKVYLMAYATSNPVEDSELNSILDQKLLQNYLKTINEYPLEFDIALPLYSWGIVTNHLGKKKLINGVNHLDLERSEYKRLNTEIYEVTNDVFLRGIWLNKGFIIKVETITPEMLKEAKTYLNKKIKHPYNLVYYHLDSLFTQRFHIDDLK